MEMKYGAVVITPEDARSLLEMNTANRSLRQSHVDYLVRAINHGEWQMTTDAIGVSEDLELVNGQHRLHAICKANRSAITLLVAPSFIFDKMDSAYMQMPSRTRHVVDCGIPRTQADRTGMDRKLCELVTIMCKKQRPHTPRFSAQEITIAYNTHPEMFDWAAKKRPNTRGLGRVHVWLAFMEFYLKAPRAAEIFVDAVLRPAPDIQQAAILREKMISLGTGSSSRIGWNKAITKASYNTAIYCIQKWMNGEEIKRIRPCEW